MAELKQSKNQVQLMGTLNEMNLKETTKEVVLKKNKDDNGTKVTCKVIEKKEFKNPSMTVDVNGNIIDVEYFGVNFGVAEKRFDEDGNIVDNKNFKSLETILNNYNPKIGGDTNTEPTRVKVYGKIGLNEYASTNRNLDGDFYSIMQITAFGVSSSGVSEEDSADAEISGVIYRIGHETKDEEETGRLLVELVSVGYNDVAEPYKFVVEEDIASDFEDYYEVGSSVKVNYEITTKQIGSTRQTSGGFGRRNAKIVSGYKITEYSIFRGDDPLDEENELFVSTDTVKKLMEEREVMIANKIKDAIEKAKESGGSTKSKPSPSGASKASGGGNPFGGEKKNPFGDSGTKKKNPFA